MDNLVRNELLIQEFRLKLSASMNPTQTLNKSKN
jgi:hypothetical protein